MKLVVRPKSVHDPASAIYIDDERGTMVAGVRRNVYGEKIAAEIVAAVNYCREHNIDLSDKLSEEATHL